MPHFFARYLAPLHFFAIGLLVVLSACQPGPVNSTPGSATTVKPAAQFTLHILADTRSSLKLADNDCAASWKTLQQVDLATALFSLGVAELETYNWAGQTLTLTVQATQALTAKLADQAHPDHALLDHAFVITLDDQPVYGGVFYFQPAAAAFDCPLSYARLTGGQLSFTLRPKHSFVGYADVDPTWYGIKDQRIKDLLAQAGKLQD